MLCVTVSLSRFSGSLIAFVVEQQSSNVGKLKYVFACQLSQHSITQDGLDLSCIHTRAGESITELVSQLSLCPHVRSSPDTVEICRSCLRRLATIHAPTSHNTGEQLCILLSECMAFCIVPGFTRTWQLALSMVMHASVALRLSITVFNREELSTP